MLTMYSTLQVFPAQALLLYCVTLISGGVTTPISTPLGAYRSESHIFGTVTLDHMPSQPYIPNIPHPKQVEVQWLGMF